MNSSAPQARSEHEVSMQIVIAGFTDGYYQQPWQEFRDQSEAYNYELSRQIGNFCRVLRITPPARITFRWLSDVINTLEQSSLAADEPPPFPRSPRPPHLVLADLNNELRARKLPAFEETY